MIGSRVPQRGLRIISMVFVFLLIGTLLIACGEADEAGNGGGSGDNQPTPTTSASNTPVPTQAASPPGTGDQIVHPTGTDELVLRIEYVGGFVPQEFLVTRVPIFSLYGDGCFVTEGPVIAIFPPPALPNLLETCVSEEGMQEILRLAQEAGMLDENKTFEQNMVADAPTTVFTVNADGRTVVIEAYALGIEASTDQLPPDEIAAREKLSEFVQIATGFATQLPADLIVEPEHSFEYDRLRLVTMPVDTTGTPTADQGIEPSRMEWPLETPLSEFGEPYPFMRDARCGVVEGTDLETLRPELEQTNTLTRWASDGEEYVFLVRPLLPDEAGCQIPEVRS